MEALFRLTVESIDKVGRGISKSFMLLIIPLVAVMLFEALARYFFNAPTIWAPQLSMMIFGVYIIFAGVASVIDKVQVGVDLISSKLSERSQAILNSITYVFTFTFFYSLFTKALYYGIESVEMQEISTSAWGQPIYHLKMLIAVGIFFTLLQTVSEFLRNLFMAITGSKL